MKHSKLVRFFFRKLVYQIKCKVKLFCIFKLYLCGSSLFILNHIDKLVINSVLSISVNNTNDVFGNCFGILFSSLYIVSKNYRIERTVLSVYRNHTVGCITIVVNAVPGAQNFLMFTYLNHQMPLDYYVAFLSLVGCKLYISILCFLTVSTANKKRLCYTIFKSIRQVVVHHTVRLCDFLSCTCTCHRI